ncbi:MAG TPA: hypothetical protein VGJ00_07810 [Rhabdochlamydiaceae bacterium]
MTCRKQVLTASFPLAFLRFTSLCKSRVLVGGAYPIQPRFTPFGLSCAAILLCDLNRRAAQARSYSHFVGPYSRVASQSEV